MGFYEIVGLYKIVCLMVLEGSGGCKNVGEACRIRFQQPWYLSDLVVPSYDKKIQIKVKKERLLQHERIKPLLGHF